MYLKRKKMQIKTWHKVVFVGSIVAFIAYQQRNRIGRGLNYIRNKFGELVTGYATKWIGVEEVGNNRSFANSVFQQMMRTVGWNSGDQWCMYFAKAIHYDIFKDEPAEQAKIKKILSGNTQRSFESVLNDKTNTYKAIESGSPKVGDIAIWRRNSASGHAGVVVEVNNDGTMYTIEGNTSDRNISDGDLVAKKKRPSVIGKNIPNSDLKLRGFIRKVF